MKSHKNLPPFVKGEDDLFEGLIVPFAAPLL